MTSKLSNLAPANGSNAIVLAGFAIDLDSPPGDASLAAAFAALAPQMTGDGFDPPQPNMLLTIAVTAGGPVSNVQQLGGYTFVRKNTAGQPIRDVSFGGSSISVVVRDYTRWHSIWPEVQSLFERCSPFIVSSGRAIKSIALQYIDKFTWRVANAPFPTKEVLRTGSSYVLPATLDLVGPWHNQFGCQDSQPATSWASHRLQNVNLNVALEGGFYSLTIFTIYRYVPRIPGKASPDFVTAVASTLFNEAHDDNKGLLRAILTEDVCDMIKLND